MGVFGIDGPTVLLALVEYTVIMVNQSFKQVDSPSKVIGIKIIEEKTKYMFVTNTVTSQPKCFEQKVSGTFFRQYNDSRQNSSVHINKKMIELYEELDIINVINVGRTSLQIEELWE